MEIIIAFFLYLNDNGDTKMSRNLKLLNDYNKQ